MRKTVYVGDFIDKMSSETWRGNNNQRVEMKLALKKAVNVALTQRQRECMNMYFLEEMTIEEIGERLNIDPSTVSRHIKAARVKLVQLRGMIQTSL